MPGRLTYWKGQEKFIEALNILIEDYSITNFQAILLDLIKVEGYILKNFIVWLKDIV